MSDVLDEEAPVPKRRIRARRSAFLSYVLFVAAGIVLSISPLTSLDESSSTGWVVAWHSLLVLGAFAAVVGKRTRKHTVEITGATILVGMLVTYAAVLLFVGVVRDNLAVTGLGLLLLAGAAMVLTHGLDVLASVSPKQPTTPAGSGT